MTRNERSGERGRGLLRGAQGAVQDGRGGAVLGVEVGVAAAHGEPVRLAHDRAGHDPDSRRRGRRSAIRRHHGHLLGVLLAEDGAVGADGQEQLGHDGRHAAEVLRAGGALQAGARPGHRDGRAEAGG